MNVIFLKEQQKKITSCNKTMTGCLYTWSNKANCLSCLDLFSEQKWFRCYWATGSLEGTEAQISSSVLKIGIVVSFMLVPAHIAVGIVSHASLRYFMSLWRVKSVTVCLAFYYPKSPVYRAYNRKNRGYYPSLGTWLQCRARSCSCCIRNCCD